MTDHHRARFELTPVIGCPEFLQLVFAMTGEGFDQIVGKFVEDAALRANGENGGEGGAELLALHVEAIKHQLAAADAGGGA